MNGKFRKVLFWLHLIAGVVAGVVIFIMSATGMVLAFEKEIVAWAERDVRRVTPPTADAKPLGLEERLAKLREEHPGERPSNITLEVDPTIAVAVSYGRTNTFYLNPYSGEIRQSGAKGMRDLFKPWDSDDAKKVADKLKKGELGPVKWHAQVFNKVMGDGHYVSIRSKAEDKSSKGEENDD